MDHDLICSWLGLPPGTWPPDHYRLLGLEAGEDNAELIEQRVHERLDAVRCYQMMHPEQATEAMNRLAQAFVCLTEPSSKKTYDVQLGIAARATSPVADAPGSPILNAPGSPILNAPGSPIPNAPSSPSQPNPMEWLPNPAPSAKALTEPAPKEVSPPALPAAAPPLPAVALRYEAVPVPLTKQPPPLPPVTNAPGSPPVANAPGSPPVADAPGSPDADDADQAGAPPMAIPIAPPLLSAPPLEPADPFLEVARSGIARRGIGTKRGLYQRIARTRQLLRLWNDLGKYLSSPKRRLSRAVDGPELIRLLDEITNLLQRFPPLLGEAGQPGYLVLALTQVDTIKVFQSFSPHQREALSRDWSSGIKLLTAHRDFLRQELRTMRKRPLGQRLVRAGWSLLVDQPGTVLLLLALLAINIALWRSYAEELWQRLFSH